MEKYLSLEEYKDGMWKFEDTEGNIILSEDEIRKILPLTKDYSLNRWNNWISANKDEYQFRLISEAKINMEKDNFYSPRCAWEDKVKEKEFIKKLRDTIDLQNDEPITYFWSAHEAIETEWSVYIKYWSDFWYPGYEGIVVPHNSNKAIIFTDNDFMFLVNRKLCFGAN